MLTWIDVIKFANNGNPTPDKRVEKTAEEWREILTPEQFQIARLKGTERAGTGEFCERHEPGLYGCVCCGTPLFDSRVKFESGTGWPSFAQPVKENAIGYIKDTSYGMTRVEVVCNTCDAHQGHVFPDGPEPSGLRYCINSASMQLLEDDNKETTAVIGGGCFWCTEAVFQRVKGVSHVESGYSGGAIKNPTYREICTGRTGHAEVIKITYNPEELPYADLLRIFFSTHDPTTLNRQGYDQGTQYRSVIYFQDEEEQRIATEVMEEMADYFDDKIVTELSPLGAYYPAGEDHQNYYNEHRSQGYCTVIIDPKIQKLRAMFSSRLKPE
ncbi:bifunctional methionine sulfoxide reductase B/A protein [Roseivirga misakiensis]|uniref:Peptide methionine sulfoxide reductase MsrA n=1 Tax=Roseivirga misakiensis TaxID=1563681 RepID=A0A1E5T252_9BACT|nr:protein-methionine-S-oxide reductase [Roseivirga misakiensis]